MSFSSNVKYLSEFIPKKSSFLSWSWSKARPTSLDLANRGRYPLLSTPRCTSKLSSTDLSMSKLLNNGPGNLASIYRQRFKSIHLNSFIISSRIYKFNNQLIGNKMFKYVDFLMKILIYKCEEDSLNIK